MPVAKIEPPNDEYFSIRAYPMPPVAPVINIFLFKINHYKLSILISSSLFIALIFTFLSILLIKPDNILLVQFQQIVLLHYLSYS